MLPPGTAPNPDAAGYQRRRHAFLLLRDVALQLSTMFNAFRQSTRTLERQICAGPSTSWRRCNQTSSLPWFVDKDYTRPPPPHISPRVPHQPKPLPPDAPEHLANLHNVLCKSPLLEAGHVEVLPFQPHQPGPSLPNQFPKGRRRRGRTEFGVGIPDDSGGLWRWVVMAQVSCVKPLSKRFYDSLQVKEGTEKRGALQSVFRLIRKEVRGQSAIQSFCGSFMVTPL